jgi:hypothetical protein
VNGEQGLVIFLEPKSVGGCPILNAVCEYCSQTWLAQVYMRTINKNIWPISYQVLMNSSKGWKKKCLAVNGEQGLVIFLEPKSVGGCPILNAVCEYFSSA